MNVRLYIDIESGEVRRELGAAALTGLAFTAGNRVPLEVIFVRGGTEVTSTVLASSAILQVGLRSAAVDGALLALADSYTLAGQVASMTLSLATQAVVDEIAALPSTWREAEAWFEVATGAADESTRQTVTQLPARIRRDYIGDDAAPEDNPALYLLRSVLLDANNRAVAQQFPGVRVDVTSAALHRAVSTAGRSVPWLIFTLESDLLTPWVLRAKESGEDDDGTTYREPDDYDLSTNDVVWVRTTFA